MRPRRGGWKKEFRYICAKIFDNTKRCTAGRFNASSISMLTTRNHESTKYGRGAYLSEVIGIEGVLDSLELDGGLLEHNALCSHEHPKTLSTAPVKNLTQYFQNWSFVFSHTRFVLGESMCKDRPEDFHIFYEPQGEVEQLGNSGDDRGLGGGDLDM